MHALTIYAPLGSLARDQQTVTYIVLNEAFERPDVAESPKSTKEEIANCLSHGLVPFAAIAGAVFLMVSDSCRPRRLDG